MKKIKNKYNFSRQYINNIKNLFPVIRKQEKDYLLQMRNNLDDYCDNHTVISLEEIYNEFGKPQDVVYEYYSTVNIEKFFSFIRLRRLLKIFLISIVSLLLAFMLFISILLYKEHLAIMRMETIYIDYEINDVEEVIQ